MERNESKAGARSGSRAQTLLTRASSYMWEKGSGVLSDFSCHSSPIWELESVIVIICDDVAIEHKI